MERAICVVMPLQMAVVSGKKLTLGNGLTIMDVSPDGPSQPSYAGVMVKVAVPGVHVLGLRPSVWEIWSPQGVGDPEQFCSPVTPPVWAVVQE